MDDELSTLDVEYNACSFMNSTHLLNVDNATDVESVASHTDDQIDDSFHEALSDTISCSYISDCTLDSCFRKKGLQILHLNVHYLYTKLDDIKLLVSQHTNIDIMCFCETFLDSRIFDSVVEIEGFSLIRKDRPSNGGGILIYVNSNLSVKRIYDLEHSAIESIWCELRYPNSKPILLCYCYRPPSSKVDWLTDFTESLEKANTECKECIIFGDFNFDICKTSGNSKTWIDLMSSFNFTQLVNNPTRISIQSKTLIDHVFTNMPQNVIDINVPVYSISDHYPVCFTRKHTSDYPKGPVHKAISYRSLKYFDEYTFLQDLSQQPWSIIEACDDLNQCFQEFIAIFNTVLNKHAPLKSRRVKRIVQPEWINSDILDAIKTRDYFKKHGNIESYKLWRQEVKYLVTSSKHNHYNTIINHNTHNPKQLWSHLKELTGLHNNVQTQYLLDEDGCQIIDPYDTANIFNNHFVNVHKLYDTSTTSSPTYTNSSLLSANKEKLKDSPPFTIPPISCEFVLTELRKLNTSKSTGCDNINAKFLKLAASIIAPILTKLFNLSLSSGVFPDAFKVAKVIPIYKSGPKSVKGNYRPISVLPVMSLIFERHVSSCLRHYLESNNLLYNRQSGFRKHHSCQSALTLLLDDWIAAIDNNEIVGSIFLDLSKAFDLVDHTILLEKMNMYNFSELSLRWCKSYLSSRKQITFVSGVKSDAKDVLFGVPQGSVLGPIFFLIFINDLPLDLQFSHTDMFADDSTISKSNRSINVVAEMLSLDLVNVDRWCRQNNMALNPTKTVAMFLCSNIKHRNLMGNYPPINLNGTHLSNSAEVKLLGVSITNTLCWDTHINNVLKKCNSYLYLLSRIKPFLSLDKRKLFFNAYILPHIDYCCTIWGQCSSSSESKLIKFQKRAARLILDKGVDTPSSELFSKLGWMSFPNRVKFQTAVLMYKSLNGLAPSYLRDKFQNTYDITHKNLRSSSSNSLYIPKPSCELFRNSFVYSGSSVWNQLPLKIRSAPSLKSFKFLYLQWARQLSIL